MAGWHSTPSSAASDRPPPAYDRPVARPPRTLGSSDDEEALRDYHAALDELERSALAVADVFERVARSGPQSRDHLERGGRVSDIPATIHLRDLREDISDVLDHFNRARMTTRVMTARLASAEGTSLSELARQFGVSRQYMSKLLHDRVDGDERGG